jgi:hypothetical protein
VPFTGGTSVESAKVVEVGSPWTKSLAIDVSALKEPLMNAHKRSSIHQLNQRWGWAVTRAILNKK